MAKAVFRLAACFALCMFCHFGGTTGAEAARFITTAEQGTYLAEFTTDGNSVVGSAIIGPLSYRPMSLAIDSSGSIYAIANNVSSEWGYSSIARIDQLTGMTMPYGEVFNHFRIPAIEVDSSGVAYAGSLSGSFFRIDTMSGNLLYSGNGSVVDVMDYAIDRSGNLWAVGVFSGCSANDPCGGMIYLLDKATGAPLMQGVIRENLSNPNPGAIIAGAGIMGIMFDENNVMYGITNADRSLLYRMELPQNGIAMATYIGDTGLVYAHGGDGFSADGPGDMDGDGLADSSDNCPQAYNPDQTDSDGDGMGDACDMCWFDASNDVDSDGVCGSYDNCPFVFNPDQSDNDFDGLGDACDVCMHDASNDIDSDGICGGYDNCPSMSNPDQADNDGDFSGDVCDSDDDNDGIADDLDNCPVVPGTDQTDSDGDGAGNICDSCPLDAGNDGDGDGVCGDVDNCPLASNPDQSDRDGDGEGDICDACPNAFVNDADGDGACDDTDNCLGVYNPDQAAGDKDTLGAACDNCPYTFNPDQADSDGDGTGDRCEFHLPDTGQTTCSDASGLATDCPDAGLPLAQDGSYSINPPAYSGNGDRTITDWNTGLMWEREYSTDDYVGSIWHAERYCDELATGGYSDWRVPTKAEMMSITYFGSGNLPLYTKSGGYWTSTEDMVLGGRHWVVYSIGWAAQTVDDYGFPENPPGHYVRCVRGAAAPGGSMTDNGDGTVTDNRTGLVWQQNEIANVNWAGAINYCESLQLGGKSDWRMPSVKELESLTDSSRHAPAIDTALFPSAVSQSYWTSTSAAHNNALAWIVDFRDGEVRYQLYEGKEATVENGEHPYHARCVRGGKDISGMVAAGANIVVKPVDRNGGGQLVTVTFDEVLSAGYLSVTSSASVPPIPSGFALGTPALYHEISTSAESEYSGGIRVCISYAAVAFPGGGDIRLLHGTGSGWTDITDAGYPDPATKVICGTADSLSPFVVVETTCLDPDGDGICSENDNCPANPNPDQVDSDGDGIGDACDMCDNRPITGSVQPSTAYLWPPNHKLDPVSIAPSLVMFNRDYSVKIEGVEAFEQFRNDNGQFTTSVVKNKNRAAADYEIAGNLDLLLRKELTPGAISRVYRINVAVSDCSGTYSFSTDVKVEKQK